MSQNILINPITVTNGLSVTMTEDSANIFDLHLLYSTAPVTITNGITIAHAGTPSQDVSYVYNYESANITYTSGAFTFFGVSLDASVLVTGTDFRVVAIYNRSGGGNGWKVDVIPEYGTIKDSSVLTAAINDNAVTLAKMAGLAAGNVIQGDAAGDPEVLDNSNSGNLIIGNGTKNASVAVTGDVTITSAGVTAIGASKVTSSMIVDATIVNGDIANTTITGGKLAAKTVQISNMDEIQLHTVDAAAFTSANSASKQTAGIITIAADDLHDTNTGLRITITGRTGATANAKTIGFDLVDTGGTTALFTNTTTASPNALHYRAELVFMRTSTTAYVAHGKFTFDAIASEIVSNITGSLGGGDDFDTNAVVINITALEGTPAGGEVIVDTIVAELLR
jgi:hypothetical protein